MLWESQTAFQLLANNNQTLLEAFQSPLVYRVFGMDKVRNHRLSTQSWDRQVLSLTGSTYDRKRLAHSALNQGETNYHRLIKGKSNSNVFQKNYIHVIRKVRVVEWLLDETNTAVWPPPIFLPALLRSLRECTTNQDFELSYPPGNIPSNIKQEIMDMIKPSNLPFLQSLGYHHSFLDSWIPSRITFLKISCKHKRVSKEREAAIISQWEEIMVPLLKASSAFLLSM
mmetsp:Transcript_29062/g.42853  ORF Transcript_29062/g.42853 Transcript_29062/m.42853 type:complete len:227 (+) Transcript_29062:2400-3080(+)